MLKTLRSVNRLEVLVAIGFTLIGFSVGSFLISNQLDSKIQLDSSKEVPQADPKPPQTELSPEINGPNVPKVQVTDLKQPHNQDLSATPSSPNNEFTSLSQEEKNCIIWKNAYPEAAYKLKQGDACY